MGSLVDSLSETILSFAKNRINEKREACLKEACKNFIGSGEKANGPVLFWVISFPFTFPKRYDGGVVPCIRGKTISPGMVNVRKEEWERRIIKQEQEVIRDIISARRLVLFQST